MNQKAAQIVDNAKSFGVITGLGILGGFSIAGNPKTEADVAFLTGMALLMLFNFGVAGICWVIEKALVKS